MLIAVVGLVALIALIALIVLIALIAMVGLVALIARISFDSWCFLAVPPLFLRRSKWWNPDRQPFAK
jgi:hypothetical protein